MTFLVGFANHVIWGYGLGTIIGQVVMFFWKDK